MLHITVDPKLMKSSSSEITIKRARKKIEKDLILYPGAKLYFQVSPKSKKQNTVNMFVEFANQRLLQQEFSAKNWESALIQSVEHTIHTLKREFPIQRGVGAQFLQL